MKIHLKNLKTKCSKVQMFFGLFSFPEVGNVAEVDVVKALTLCSINREGTEARSGR